MRDADTGSTWLHFTGECVLGELAGRSLALVPTTLLSWKSFRDLYKEGSVIAPTNPRWRRILSRVISNPPVFFMPGFFRPTMRPPDNRLPESELGLGLVIRQRHSSDSEARTEAKFYPWRLVRAAGVVNDRMGDLPVVVVSDPGCGSALAFIAVLDGQQVHLRPGAGGLFSDETRGTLFDMAGRAVAGPLKGRRLQPAPAITARWYGFAATYPGASIWTG